MIAKSQKLALIVIAPSDKGMRMIMHGDTSACCCIEDLGDDSTLLRLAIRCRT